MDESIGAGFDGTGASKAHEICPGVGVAYAYPT